MLVDSTDPELVVASSAPYVDARVQSWVRADRHDLDRPLFEAVRAWLRTEWPFESVDDERTER